MAGRFMKLKEAVARVLEDTEENVDEITIIPPPADSLSDEEDIDEGCMGDSALTDVAGTVEIVKDDASVFLENQTKTVDWKKADNRSPGEVKSPFWRQDTLQPFTGKSPYEVFRIYTDGLVEFLVQETNRYCAFKNEAFRTDLDSMYSFLGILYLCGYHHIPRQEHMWSTDDDLGISVVKESLSRSDFRKIKYNLHLNDNDLAANATDKLFKVRPLITFANSASKKIELKENDKLSIDESMIAYYGRNTMKQFIRSKPIRFGYKAWCICSSDGFLQNFDIYQGQEKEKKKIPLGFRVIDARLSEAEVYGKTDVEVYFDNFFTSFDALAFLKEKGISATGTVRSNRTKNCPISDSDLKAKGDFEYRKASGVLTVCWKDNAIVRLMSNFDSVYPLSSALRYRKEEKKKMKFPMPGLIARYNSFMGGVDMLDGRIQLYHTTIKGKKWYWPIVTWIFEAMLSNAFLLFQAANVDAPVDQLYFRRQVTR